jgi:hypothetical protein
LLLVGCWEVSVCVETLGFLLLSKETRGEEGEETDEERKGESLFHPLFILCKNLQNSNVRESEHFLHFFAVFAFFPFFNSEISQSAFSILGIL